MTVIPIIDKIIENDGVFSLLNKDGETICATCSQEVANMYYAIPAILERQAEIIADLTTKLNIVSEEYNNMIMGMLPSGSRFIH